MIFSMTTAGFGLLLLAMILGMATFVESSYGAEAAKALVYGSWWFELLLLFLSVAMTVIYFRSKLYKKEKMTVGLFHLAFIVMVLGAAVTRYIGEEGVIHIREGEASNELITSDQYFHMLVSKGDEHYEAEQKVLLTPFSKDAVSATFEIGGQKLKVKSVEYLWSMPTASEATGMAAMRAKASKGARIRLSDGSQEAFADVAISDETDGGSVKGQFNGLDYEMWIGPKVKTLPFSIRLKDFQLQRYPGSMSPSSYRSEVTLEDKEQGVQYDFSIFMNNVLKHRGYRFYQSSYDQDEKGTILSVNKDLAGTNLTYLGYFLLFLSILLSIFHKKSHFYRLMQKAAKPVAVVFLLLVANGLSSQAATAVSSKSADDFAKVWVQGHDGRIKPFSTLAYEVVMKVSRQESLEGLSPEQAVLSMIAYPEEWQKVPMIALGDAKIEKLLGVDGKASFAAFFDDKGNYKMMKEVGEAYAKQPSQRGTFDNAIIKVDDRLNVAYMVFKGEMVRLFPSSDRSNTKWEDLTSAPNSTSGAMMMKVLSDYLNAVQTNDPGRQKSDLDLISQFQHKLASELIPGDAKGQMEITYNRINIFRDLSFLYLLAGLLLMFFYFKALVSDRKIDPRVVKYSVWIFLFGFALHTVGLIIRGYIANHMPWSDGYESMIYIAWAGMLAGILFARKNPMVMGAAALLSGLTLFVAQMSWLNPEITNLVPVLKSYWLAIHVAVITGSYGFLGVSAIIGLSNLMLAALVKQENRDRVARNIEQMSWINEAAMTLGLYLLTIGTFLGAIWANESWGRYWGWDPKETWSLVTILVYAFITHMRMMPGYKGWYAFNLASVVGLLCVLMTYLGVNYYLTGLHSYGSGSATSFPVALVVVIVLIGGVAWKAWNNKAKPDLFEEN
ncbi:MAG: cytochrome c biogenesis protein CcsA [Marinilabiliales bacterium]|nr:cytochrome c biogenesis protein CcsA [Marinilabiliales bacterium]